MPLTVAPHGADPRALYAIAFGPLGDPVRLVGDPERLPVHQAGRTGLLFDLRHQFRLVESEPRNRRPEWRVSTVSYQYRVLDVRRRELLVWHWQPGEDFDGPDRPHLHVSAKLMANTSPHEDTQINEIDLALRPRSRQGGDGGRFDLSAGVLLDHDEKTGLATGLESGKDFLKDAGDHAGAGPPVGFDHLPNHRDALRGPVLDPVGRADIDARTVHTLLLRCSLAPVYGHT